MHLGIDQTSIEPLLAIVQLALLFLDIVVLFSIRMECNRSHFAYTRVSSATESIPVKAIYEGFPERSADKASSWRKARSSDTGGYCHINDVQS